MTELDILISSSALDDAGARTADLYDWQAAMAAADGLALLARHLAPYGGLGITQGASVICEHHEDWIVKSGAAAELVSAKHREPSTGPWKTINELVSAGGIGHLFSRWLILEKLPYVRLVTCASLLSGPARDFAECPTFLRQLDSGKEHDASTTAKLQSRLNEFVKALLLYRKDLPDRWKAPEEATPKELVITRALLDEAGQFVRMLTIEDDRPPRSLTAHSAPSLYARPLLEKMNHPSALDAAVWEAVLQLFRARMRARGPSKNGGLPSILSAASPEQTASSLETRTVTVEDVEVAVRFAVENPAGFVPTRLPRRLTTLSMKMVEGGCTDTSIERAEILRRDFNRYRRERRNSVPGSSAEQAVLVRSLMKVADAATVQTAGTSDQWGSALWYSLSERLDEAPSSVQSYELDGDLALGGICELTARCKVWFSPRFDVKTAILQAKKQRDGRK